MPVYFVLRIVPLAAGSSGLMMTSGRALCAKESFRRNREQWVDDD